MRTHEQTSDVLRESARLAEKRIAKLRVELTELTANNANEMSDEKIAGIRNGIAALTLQAREDRAKADRQDVEPDNE